MKEKIVACLVLMMLSQLSLRAQDCNSASAGTFSIDPFEASSEVTADREYTLCYGQSLRLTSNGDQNLSADPDASTSSGIGYMVFSAEPTVSGNNWADITTGNSPVMVGGQPLIIFGDQQGNSAIFQNLESLNQNHRSVWLAPVTLNDFNEAKAGNPQNEGSCVKLTVADAVQVNLLKQIQIEIIQSDSTSVTFRVTGGLPEWDGTSRYDYEVRRYRNLRNPPVVLDQGNDAFGFNVQFTSNYVSSTDIELYVNDGFGCMQQVLINGLKTTDTELTASFECRDVVPGEQICVPIRISGSDTLALFTIYYEYNSSVLRFSHVQDPLGFNPIPSTPINGLTGLQIVTNRSTNLSTNNGIFLELCFEVIGSPGEYSTLDFRFALASFLAARDNEPSKSIYESCQINVINDPSSLFYDYSACPDGDGNVNLSISNLTGEAPYTLIVEDVNGNQVLNEIINSTNDNLDFNFQIGTNPHRISITDNAGSSLEHSGVEFDDEILDFEFEITNTSCGNGVGTITVTSYSGPDTATLLLYVPDSDVPQTYVISDLLNNPIENLLPGNYRMELVAPNGNCSVIKEVEIVDGEIQIEVDLSQEIDNCGDDDSTLVTLTFSNYSLPPTGADILRELVVWSADGKTRIRRFPQGIPPVYSFKLPQGSYLIEITDAADCEGRVFLNIWPSMNEFPVVDTINDPICTNGGPGANPRNDAIKLKFNNVYTDVTISLLNLDRGGIPEIVTTDVPADSIVRLRDLFTGIFEGLYRIIISSNDFCESPIVLILQQNAIDMAVEDFTIIPYCDEDNQGAVRIDSLRNSHEIEYAIDFTTRYIDTTYFPGILFDSLGPTNHRFIIRDRITGCSLQPGFEIDIPEEGVPFEIDTEMPPQCPNDPTGRFTIRIPSGDTLDSVRVENRLTGQEIALLTGPISDGQIVDGLPSGTYDVFGYAGSAGCASQEIAMLDALQQLPEFGFTTGIVIKQPSCENDNVLILVGENNVRTNGTPISDIHYVVASEMGDTINLGDTFSGFLAEGRYLIWLKVGDCLSEADTFTVTYDMTDLPNIRNPNLLVVEAPSCALDDAVIRLDSTNVNLRGIDPSEIRLVIDDSIFGDELFLDSTYNLMLAEGDHKVWLSVDGCLSASETFTIMFNDLNLPSIIEDSLIVLRHPFCTNDSTLIRIDSTNVNLLGMDPNMIRFVIDDSLSADLLNLDTTYSLNLGEGEHKIWLEVSGCLSMADTFTIELNRSELPSIIDASRIVERQPICSSDSTLIRLDSTNVRLNGIDPSEIRYVIDDSANGEHLILDTSYLIPLGGGTHSIWLVYNGCYQEVEFFMVNQGVSPEPMLEQDIYSVNLGDEIEISEISGVSFSLYQWSFNGQILRQTTQGTLIFPPPGSGTIYLVVQDNQGCTGIDSARIDVIEEAGFNIPNVFSPNAEQAINQRFKPIISGGNDIEGGRVQSFSVFDRYGRQVWSSTNVPLSEFRRTNTDFGWDGTHNGQELPSDVYVFVMKVKFLNFTDVRLVSGSVTLIR